MPASPIRKLVPYAETAKKKGIKVYHLNIGQPDIPTPEVALEAIRNFDPIKGVPVVFFTSSTSLDDMKKAYNLGVSKFYSKTFNNEEYFKRVKSFLELIQKK
jgi:aspartate aminotransferase